MDDMDFVQAFAALAHAHRLDIFRKLVAEGPSGLRAGQIARQLGIGATSLSFHLKELSRAGLICSVREGRYVRYAVNIEGVRQMIVFLTENCCQGQPALCGGLFADAPEFCTSTGQTKETSDV